MPFEFKRYDSRGSASIELASQTAATLQDAIRQEGFASVVLTGGSSPSDVYTAWAEHHRTNVEWNKVHFFWGDERNVAHDHEHSNVTLAQSMLETLMVPSANIHPWKTNLAPAKALQDMRQVLRKLDILGDKSFTISLFGVGEDGHIASLFPADEPWRDFEAAYPAVARFISDSPKPPSERYTFTLPLINKSREIHLLPFGKTKAEVIKQLAKQDPSISATWLQGREKTIVWTDDE
jgi:6-phosphogluconolactonase